MTITQVRAQFDGQWHPLTYNSSTGNYETSLTPTTAGNFNIVVEATDDQGNSVTTDGADHAGLNLTVTEAVVSAPQVRAKLDGQWHTLTYNEDTDSYETYLTPTRSSTSEPDGYFNIVVEVSDSSGKTNSVDGTEFDGLRLVVKEDEKLKLTGFWLPENNIVDVPFVTLTGYITDLDSDTVNVKITVNGTDIGEIDEQTTAVETDWHIEHQIPLFVGENNIVVTITNGNGLTKVYERYIIRLITDRTQADLDALKQLLATPVSQWTAEQYDEFLRSRDRGAYNYTDINRVVTAENYLRDQLETLGYYVSYNAQKNSWKMGDNFIENDTEIYVNNVHNFRKAFEKMIDLPEAPADLVDFDFVEANNIEKILVLVDGLIPYIVKSYWYSDEIYSDEA